MIKIVGVNWEGYRVGETHHRAKLTDADVRLMFDMEANGVTRKQIAEYFGVHRNTVYRILSGQARVHLVQEYKRG